MLRTRANARAFRTLATLLAAGALLLSLTGSAFGDKKKAAPAEDPKLKRIAIDTSNLVWPQPPELARVRWVQEYTGEKIDWTKFDIKGQKKQKQGWMDRLAGTQSAAQQNVKLPFQLIRTCGLTVDSKGNIYAADQGVDAIFIFNAETKDVQLIRNGKEARFGLINALAIDDNDRLFVSDDKFHKVMFFNAKHELEGAFGADVLARPGGIAIDTENRFLYVVDTENDDVVVFDADTFKVLRKIGTPGKKHQLTEPGTFSLPTNVAVDKEGNVYVTDTLNNRVEIFDADGNFISMFGKSGDGPGYFARPKGIAVDADGHIWVVDTYQDRVQVFDREGRLLIYFGEQGPYPGQFMAAYGITIDKNNRVITSEQFPGRVQVFRYVTDAEAEEARKGNELKQPDAPAENQAAPAQNAGSLATTKDSAPK
jgi:DNA-binding beta-propeller fold protein YncE